MVATFADEFILGIRERRERERESKRPFQAVIRSLHEGNMTEQILKEV